MNHGGEALGLAPVLADLLRSVDHHAGKSWTPVFIKKERKKERTAFVFGLRVFLNKE